jgi:hypothetical protein
MLPGTCPTQLFAPAEAAAEDPPVTEGATHVEVAGGGSEVDLARAAFRHWAQHHRLNMNVRQVLPE